ncbi:MAG: hypothetical protein OEW42_14680 [Acidimicrobiia bacterium]|nr:hypothetical protein [Acidimicrobiia bacterium]
MTTTLHPTPTTTPPTAVPRNDGFSVVRSDTSLGYNLPQRMGRRLWLPMFAMALTGWAVGFILAIVEAGTDRSDVDDLQTLGHLVPAFMFIGFLGVFAAITFAVARILGEFRKGGGEVQEAAEAPVETLKMPTTAKAMLGFMMMAMMVMAAGIATNFVAAGAFDGTNAADIIDSARYGAVGAGLRRLGVVTYLAGITCGLATIIEVLRFQAIRIREVAASLGQRH